MTKKEIQQIETKLDDITTILKAQAEFTKTEEDIILNKMENIAITLFRNENNNDWKGTGFFGDMTDDYK